MERSEDIFRLLEDRELRPASLEMRETEVEVAAGRVAHALDHGQRRVLLVPLIEGQRATEDVRSRGVSLRTRELIDRGMTRRFLTLRCELPGLHEPFSVLCDEVLEALLSVPDDPARTIGGVLARWRDLLGPRSNQLLGEGPLLGLLAELRVLERLLVKVAPAPALKLWTGPSTGRRDFTMEGGALEVKATTGREKFLVEVHGLRQLETPVGGRLYLWAEQMERVPTGGDCVPEAVERLVGQGMSLHDLLELMGQIGYRAADSEAYRRVRFEPVADRAFHVGEGFPCLVPASLIDPALSGRVSHVRYTVDLTDAANIPGRMDGIEEIFTALLDGA